MNIEALVKLIGGPRDGAMLRLSLGRLFLQQDEHESAIEHLRKAVAMDPAYTAAWKELGRAQAKLGQTQQAKEAYTHGIEAAQSHGDKQAEKEMTVFLRRLERSGEK